MDRLPLPWIALTLLFADAVYALRVTLLPPRKLMKRKLQRAAIETGFIIFLFYANLLMGEFTRSSRHKTLLFAINDIFTPTNFMIALFSGLVGYFVFEALRKQV